MKDLPHAKKSLGQHWLTDQASLQAMCTAAKISNTDTVLEIGSGFGSLTELLLRQAKQVIAVELDPVLAVKLVNRFHGQDLKVAPDDVL